MEDLAIVLYRTKQDVDVISKDHNVISVAFFSGSDKAGWEKEGSDNWEVNMEPNFSAYQKMYYIKNEPLFVHYGEIFNNEIKSIQTKDRSDNHYVQARLIEKDGLRYYLQVGDISDMKALDNNGNLIEKNKVCRGTNSM